MTQYGFYVDSSRCSGCKTCQVSCKDKNELDVGPKFRRVYEYGGGSWIKSGNGWMNNTYSYYLSISCNHCDEPTCVQGCPTGAMHKREQDGLVVVNQDVCVGCRYCELRCPYGAPQYDEHKQLMTKCDGCFDRVEQGLMPTCVESCPQRALDFGPIDELRQRYGSENAVAPLPDPSLTRPNLIVKPHPAARPSGDKNGAIMNPKEI
ncbi:DMSO/selenate family reductase complex B subunit [Providencia alcalifaciens]|uniref:DMSO/selenate family reductase complex B subunit n=1 Tax=Providencia alcalifaciens TaxID=126385 RepID=UPI002B0531E4|nr:DMSO/selenate family reductase complex B subunit [Providencia alcalifaciens]